MTKNEIFIYTIPDCIHCGSAKHTLNKLGYDFTEICSAALAKNLGLELVPALRVNGELMDYAESMAWIAKEQDKAPIALHILKDPGIAHGLISLSPEFLAKYPSHPEHMTPLGLFTFYRTYSRFLPELGRRETWKETVKRAVEYNINIDPKHRIKIGLPVPWDELTKEAEELFDNIFNLRQFPAGRLLWVANTEAVKKYPMSNFNCSFTNIEKWGDLGEVFYLLMLGSGVGFKCTPDMAAGLAPIRTNVNLLLSEYRPVLPEQRLEHTEVRTLENGFAKIYVGDSKEGWRDALLSYFDILTNKLYEGIHTLKISFNSIRPRGERLKTFGGTASGPEPLKEMFIGFDAALKNQIDPALKPIVADNKGYGQARPIHILDMTNLIGHNVVSGGVRRSAELFLFDPSDYECLFAKYGINGFWSAEHFKAHEDVKAYAKEIGVPLPPYMDELSVRKDVGFGPHNPGRTNISHRRLSNNSMALTGQLDPKMLHLVMLMLKLDGEPGFINMEAAGKRRENMQGINPCFRGDMQILTTEGYRSFEELDGQEVTLINHKGQESHGKVWCSGEKEIWEILLSDARKIYVTEDHVFMTSVDDEAVQAKDLFGKRLKSYERSYHPLVMRVKSTGEFAKVYDFSEPLEHWGVVEDLVVHNCAEILLDSKQQCNLSTLNMTAFVKDGYFNYAASEAAQKLSARLGVRMTLLDLELPEWNEKQKRDRLIGTSMTGWEDAMGAVKVYHSRENILAAMREASREAADEYAKQLRIPSPLLATTQKPEGSLSLVAGGVSPGIHSPHSHYFIRRIRVSSDDAMAKMALAQGWVVNPEVGQTWENARTLVIDFPVKSNAFKTKDNVGAVEQLDRYFMFQEYYTEHNTSNTITIKPDEWDAVEQKIAERWDDFVGVSFLSHDGGTYQLAPYEAITKEEYEKLAAEMKPFDPAVLERFERGEEFVLDDDPDCAGGACPVR